MASDLERLKVNSPLWTPNDIFKAKNRWFKRPDGVIFALPETEDWHIQRVLGQGFVEVDGPLTEKEKAELAAKEGKPWPPPAPPDPRDAEIAALKAKLAAMEASDGSTPADGADSGQGTGADLRPAQQHHEFQPATNTRRGR